MSASSEVTAELW